MDRSWAQSANVAERRMLPWAKAATIAYPVLGIVTALIAFATSSDWARYFHDFRVWIDNLAVMPRPQAPMAPKWNWLIVPFSTVAQIVFVVWQYRAAVTAQRLGYPAKRSPALGAWSYLIPVVQFWFPYQALRDCLPPGDSNRPMVLSTWLLLILTGVINALLIVLLAEAHGLGVLLVLIQIGLEVFLASLGYRLVTIIAAAHGKALATT
jgi:hypothetical protein